MQCLTPPKCDLWREQHCRRHQWKRQATCCTPLKRLPEFTATIVPFLQPFDRALLIALPILPTWHLDAFRRKQPALPSKHDCPNHAYAFENEPDALRITLEAALADPVDLRVLFSPTKHALTASHDEWLTFFSQSSGRVGDFRHAMTAMDVNLYDWIAEQP